MKQRPVNLLPEKGEAYFYPAVFGPEVSDAYFSGLSEEISWRQTPIKIFGREIMQPRLTAWFADPGTAYGYSGIKLRGEGWNPLVAKIKEAIEPIAGVKFSGALLNYYRTGADS
ncbi:MAG: alpha-ketoglutarate-dependent dioxygenase AlkB, partial [Proteobacteria bacterium]